MSDKSMGADLPGAAKRLAEYYRQRASQCREAAEHAVNAETREEWLRLTNEWVYLALHVGENQSAPDGQDGSRGRG